MARDPDSRARAVEALTTELKRYTMRRPVAGQIGTLGMTPAEIVDIVLAAVVSSSPATPEGGREAQQRIDAALALCHRADYGGDDWPYPDHYVPASRIRDALTDEEGQT